MSNRLIQELSNETALIIPFLKALLIQDVLFIFSLRSGIEFDLLNQS